MLNYRKAADLYMRGASINAIAAMSGCKWETVRLAIGRMEEKWGSLEAIPADLDNSGIRKEIQKPRHAVDTGYLQPDFDALRKECRRGRNSELWELYCRKAADQGRKPYQISYFNELLAAHESAGDISYAQEHQPGLCCQVDWTGDKGHYMDPDTGEWVELDIFVMELPYSGYFYAEAFRNQRMESFLEGHRHGFEHLGGVTPVVVPDNCATATDRRTGVPNTRYTAFLDRYGALPRPARPRSPRDKGGVERHVGIIEREILPKLDMLPITSLEEYNRLLLAKVSERNARSYSKREGSRTEVFLAEERPRLKPLPAHAYRTVAEKVATVSKDFHIQYDSAFYSVPVQHIGRKVTVRDDGHDIEIYSQDGRLVARHRKAVRRWQRVTDEGHIPTGHSEGREYTLGSFLSWAAKFGPSMEMLCRTVSESFQFPVQSFRTLNTILVKAEKCGSHEAAEKAAGRCLAAGVRSSKGFQNMLSACMAEADTERQDVGLVTLDDVYCCHGED